MVVVAAAIPTVTATASHLDPAALWMGFGFFVIGVLITIVGYLTRKQLETILENQKSYSNRQMECRETLAERFAEKDKTSEHFKELYHRTDRHERELAAHAILLKERTA